MNVQPLFGWKHMASGQGEDVTDVFTSLVTARINGDVVCYITMRGHFVLEKILAQKEALGFVWEEGFIVRSSRQEMGRGEGCDLCRFCLHFPSV